MEFLGRGSVFGLSAACPAPADHADVKLRDSFDGAAWLRGIELPVMTVNGALGEPIAAPRRIDLTAHTLQLQVFLPEAFALACALAHPLRAGVSYFFGCDSFHWRLALIPLDDEYNLALQSGRLRGNFLHQPGQTKARICAHQQRRGHQTCSHRQGTFNVVLTLECRMLHTRAQGPFKAIAQAAQGQCSKNNGMTIDATKLVPLRHQIESEGRVCVHTLTQRGARWNHTQSECAHEKHVAPKALYCIEIGFEDVDVGSPRAHGEPRIDQGIDVDALEVLTDTRQSGVQAESVGPLFDNKVGHVLAHLRVNGSCRPSL